MNAQRQIVVAAIGAAAMVACLATGARSQAPNIVLLFADDAGYADFGFMDQLTGQSTEFKTPSLDALAQQGVVFSNAYVSSPVCAPSRAGLLTGQFGGRFGVEYNISNSNVPHDGVPADQRLLSQELQNLGYSTAAVGKWHLGREAAKQPQNRGFDEFFGFWGGHRDYFGQEGGDADRIRRGDVAVDWTNEPSFNEIDPDPSNGRYVTDAFGDEAAQFISERAGQDDPFFLYVPFTSPHAPFQAKQQDLAEFDGTTLDGNRKNVAAMTLAMDRAIGGILDRIDDPNGDGDQSDSVAENTIVIFLNDNGGTVPPNGETRHDNSPLKSGKGQTYEGGIRTPMIVRAPGLAPGQFDQAVTSLDLFPTLISAAGGVQTTPTDGKDLMPYLTGQRADQVHDALFWRGGLNFWAIRKGDWKLAKPNSGSDILLFQLQPDGTGEEVDLSAQEPEIFDQLLREYVDWEVTLTKPTETTTRLVNLEDRFRLRDDVGSVVYWRGSRWLSDDDPQQQLSMTREDAYANAVLVFQPRDDESYRTVNNVSRASGVSQALIDANELENPPGLEEFVLNQVRLEGPFQGEANQSASLEGFPLMFVRSLNGNAPMLFLGANDSSAAGSFRYDVDMDLVLHANLLVAGNGDAQYVVNGEVRDFFEPRALVKRGQSTITLAGRNTYAGRTAVEDGRVVVAGAEAALIGTSHITLGPLGAMTLESGMVRTPQVDATPGGEFEFLGGRLEVDLFLGDLVNHGGEFHPGATGMAAMIDGNYLQDSGSLHLEIGGTTPGEAFDQLVVAETASLAGALEIELVDLGVGLFEPQLGDQFLLMTAVEIVGQFDSHVAPGLAEDWQWSLRQSSTALSLQIVDRLHADFDLDGDVDEQDLIVWEDAAGLNDLADADGDGWTDGSDLLIWQRERGLSLLASSSLAAVPEPTGWRLVAVALGVFAAWRATVVASTVRLHAQQLFFSRRRSR